MSSATKAVNMDLSIIRKQTQQESWVTITHPVTGEETLTRIKVLSPDSPKYREIDNKLKNQSMLAASRRGRLSAEEVAEAGLQLLIDCTLGWEGVVFDGQAMPFSQENVRTVYSEFPFIREQVDRFLADRRNFFRS